MRIKELRTERELTQVEVATALGISRQVFANYEKEINYPDPYMLIKIADFFDVSIDYLVGRTNEFDIIESSSQIKVGIEQELLLYFRKLKTESKNRVIGYVYSLTEEQ